MAAPAMAMDSNAAQASTGSGGGAAIFMQPRTNFETSPYFLGRLLIQVAFSSFNCCVIWAFVVADVLSHKLISFVDFFLISGWFCRQSDIQASRQHWQLQYSSLCSELQSPVWPSRAAAASSQGRQPACHAAEIR
jgi:hypothetical protein